MLPLRLVLSLIQQHRLCIVVLLIAYNVGFGIHEIMTLIHVEFIYLYQVFLIPVGLSHRDVTHRLPNRLLFQQLARLVVIVCQLSTSLSMPQKLHRH